MPRQKESNAELLLKLPWWVSAALGLIAFAALRWGLPAWAGDVSARQMIAKGFAPLAPLPLLFFGIFAAGSFWFAKHRRGLVDQQNSLESIRILPWKQFEYLVAEAYQRQGYQVEYSLGRGADGGVDLTVRRDGHTSLVQCKQWRVFSVGAPVIREMFGLMTAERADEAIIVTTGKFTRDAKDFAEGKPIRLIDGPQLLALVQSVQTSPPASSGDTVTADTSITTLPVLFAASQWCNAKHIAAAMLATDFGDVPHIRIARAQKIGWKSKPAKFVSTTETISQSFRSLQVVATSLGEIHVHSGRGRIHDREGCEAYVA